MATPLGLSNELTRPVICEEIGIALGTTEVPGKSMAVLGLGKMLGELIKVMGIPPEYDKVPGTAEILSELIAVLGLEEMLGNGETVIGVTPEYTTCVVVDRELDPPEALTEFKTC